MLQPLTLPASFKMGVTQSKTINLAAETGLHAEAYTVIRTSGERQEGWCITTKVHRCYNQNPGAWRASTHALLQQDGWRIYMHNGDHEDAEGNLNAAHACGWRTLGTFWPTHMTGDEAAIKVWSDALRDRLEELAGEQGLPDVWAEHKCGSGQHQDYCDGCCAERRADKKKALLDELKAGPTEERRLALEEELAKIPTAAQHRAWLAEKATAQADKLDAALEELGAKPYHPVYAPLKPVKPLPEPMDAALRGRLLGSMPKPEAPTEHGCAYADDGCPWNICYACEYERDPSAYYDKIRHSELIQLITAYWKSPTVGNRAKGWSTDTLEAIVGFLNQPRAERPFTDEQVCDSSFKIAYRSPEYHLLAGLRELNA